MTGVAGFVGSTLVKHAAARRARGRRHRLADRLLRGRDQAPQPGERSRPGTSPSSTADLNTVDLDAAAAGRRLGLPPGRPARRPRCPGARTSRSTSGTTSRPPSACWRRPRRAPTLKRLVYASSSSVYGNAERYPTAETARPQPVSPYGVTKLAAEHLCSLYASNFGVPTVVAALLHRLRPRPAHGHGVHPLRPRRRARRGHPHLRHRRADPRLHLRRRRRRGEHRCRQRPRPNPGRCSTWPADRTCR